MAGRSGRGYIYAGRECSTGDDLGSLSYRAPDFVLDRHKNVYVADRNMHQLLNGQKQNHQIQLHLFQN